MAVISDARIKSAMQGDADAFRTEVAKDFPEATSGDLDPGMGISLMQTGLGLAIT